MAMGGKFVLIAACAIYGLAVPVAAQDWLGVHLDTQRDENMRQHQQAEQASSSEQSKEGKRYSPPISGKQRHAAMRRHHREYKHVMKERGYRAADQWLADQVAAGR